MFDTYNIIWVLTYHVRTNFFTSAFNNNNRKLLFEFWRYQHFTMKRNDAYTKNRQIKCVAAIIQWTQFSKHIKIFYLKMHKKMKKNFHPHTIHQPWINGWISSLRVCSWAVNKCRILNCFFGFVSPDSFKY